ncbi:hypothetical protein NX773_11615 [Massilia solisilvae]|uniref:ESPR domain-containing protein n=1 Tax=Massilia solisilvae TaxID=1811225 RepID=A0ABT2BJX2_9BURK|nr:hypothetical protein [Massilia solisilvae]MCS0608814.1 hypothetical protein [Massilia solisilvae]
MTKTHHKFLFQGTHRATVATAVAAVAEVGRVMTTPARFLQVVAVVVTLAAPTCKS